MTLPPARKTRLDTLALTLLLLCTAVWGLGQAAGKVGLAGFAPLLQASLRSLGAAALVLAWSAWRQVPLWQRDGTLPGGLLAGALFALEFGCIFIGLQHTSASRMAVFIYLAPFVVALGMPFISASERLHVRQMAGLLLAFAAVVWAFAEGFSAPQAGALQWFGDALGLGAALLWGLTTLTLRATAVARAAPEKTLFYQLAVSGLALGAAAWWRGEAWPLAATLPAVAVVALAFQIVVVSFVSYLTWFWLMRHYPATKISAFTLLTPVFGLMAGSWLLAEPLTPRLLLALLGVCAGLLLVNLAPAPRR